MDSYSLLESIRDPRCYTPADSSQLTLQLAHSGLACIGPDNFPNRFVSKSNLSGFKTIFRNLPGNEISLGNSQLLVLDVSRQFQDLHSVTQRAWNGIEHVSRGDEQYLT